MDSACCRRDRSPHIRIDYAFGLMIETYDERRATTNVRIASEFRFESDGTERTFDPERASEPASLIDLHQATVTDGWCAKTEFS